MKENMSVRADFKRVHDRYERNKADGKSNSLFKATIGCFACELFFQILGGVTAAVLNFMSPFIVLFLVNFIEDGVSGEELTWDSVKKGVILSALLIISQTASQII